jgi:di/tricarboxylate transporter
VTVEIALVFIIIGIALYLFATETFPLDITAILILITLIAIPLLFHSEWLVDRGVDLRSAFPTVTEGLSGLSSTATVTVLAMFILSAGIQRSGLIHTLGKLLFPLMGSSELRQILVIAMLLGLVSGFINNTATVAIAIPMVLDMARRSGSLASRMLLPVSFFAMLGGTLTLIGTSTNILASAILADTPAFGREIGMFEFTHVGLIVLLTGLVYFLTVGRWLMPRKDTVKLQSEEGEFFVVELGIPEESDLIGQSVESAKFEAKTAAKVLKLIRGTRSRIKRAATTELQVDDVMQVRGNLRQIMDLIKSDNVDVLSEFGDSRRVRKDGNLVRILLRNDRVFHERSAREVDFWNRYQARPIGLEVNQVRSHRLADEALEVGEIVLVEISRTALEGLRKHPDVVVLEIFEDEFDKRRMWLSGLIVAGVVLGAVLTPLPIVVTALAGVIAMVAAGSLTKEDIYSGVSWNVIFLLAGVIPLGIAMTKSGAAGWLAGLVSVYALDWHPLLVFMALYAITTLLTELVSNNASVVVLIPVAISMAELLDMAIFPLVLIVMFAASTSFLSPVGYQTNTMIYGTGLYKFTDFIKVGGPLNVLLMVVTSAAIYLLWPVGR